MASADLDVMTTCIHIIACIWKQSSDFSAGTVPYTLCLKKTTLVLHTITSMHINQF